MIVGHIYKYKTRDNETGSTFTVMKIDQINGSTVVSISIDGLKIKSTKSKDGLATHIGHLPISLEKLMASSPSDTGNIAELKWPNEGYEMWIDAVKNKKGGSWALTLQECISAMENILNR